jgi:hypothetical protein
MQRLADCSAGRAEWEQALNYWRGKDTIQLRLSAAIGACGDLRPCGPMLFVLVLDALIGNPERPRSAPAILPFPQLTAAK